MSRGNNTYPDIEFTGKNISELISAWGITQDDFAKSVGISMHAVRSYVSGRAIPRTDNLIRIADFFGVSVDYILERTDKASEVCEVLVSKSVEKAMRRYSYEHYLLNKRSGDSIGGIRGNIAPWPYNLLEQITQEEMDGPITDQQQQWLMTTLYSLSPREQECVLYYFRDEETFDQVASHFHVTRERIRQIVAKAIRKLRHPSRYKVIFYGPECVERQKAIQRLKAEIAELEALKAQRDDLTDQLKEVEALKSEVAEVRSVLRRPLETFDLSVRSYNCLSRAGLNNAGLIIDAINDESILRVRNLGRRSYAEILAVLKNEGYGEYLTV